MPQKVTARPQRAPSLRGLHDNSKEAASFSSLKGSWVVTHACFLEAALFLLVTRTHPVASSSVGMEEKAQQPNCGAGSQRLY